MTVIGILAIGLPFTNIILHGNILRNITHETILSQSNLAKLSSVVAYLSDCA